MSTIISWFFFLLLVSLVSSCPPNPVPNAWVPDGFCASVWTSGLINPRGLYVASNGDLLVVEAGKTQVTVLWESSPGQIMESTLAYATNINHGIAVSGGFLYASSSTTVYRWKYMAGQRDNLGSPETVINSVPCCGHSTRTLFFDQNGLLYLSTGSSSNVDSDSRQARVRRFDVTTIPGGGINWNTGYLFADGLRNEVGLAMDSQNRLWGVENGCDNLVRNDLGGDIHNNNPSEEVNLFDVPGKFYGYPYCWSEFNLPAGTGKGIGAQWAHPNFINDGVHSDAWCQNTNNVVPPKWNFPAHSAPLDIKFYSGNDFPGFPSGGAFISFHGSWNRQPPIGYNVFYLAFQNGLPTAQTQILRNNGTSATWNVRPVGLGLRKCGTQDCLYVTSDSSGQIIQISYEG